MEYLQRIATIEQRASRVGLTLHRLCVRAKVRQNGVARWKSGEVCPTVRTVSRDCSKLEAVLDQIEAELLESLQASSKSSSRAA